MSAPEPTEAAALAILAEAAGHWTESDQLTFAGDPTNAALDALAQVGGRIMREATAIQADTPEALRSKAQVLVRIEGPALRDDASMTLDGAALLRSILDDLTGERIAA
jgi:hypothetical protein